MQKLTQLMIFIICLTIPSLSNGYVIKQDFFSPLGGALSSAGDVSIITQCSMQPYGKPTQQDLQPLFNKAVNLQQQGEAFKDSLSFYDCESNPSDPVCTLLWEPNENYESLGFIDDFQTSGIEENLRSAIEYFAYLYEYDYPDAFHYLQLALRDLVSIYMVFADEFLIDALDYRFSAIVPNLDDYLDEQIDQLTKAVQYYQSGSQAFISVWLEPIGWSNQIIGQLFTQDEWDLFNLLYQRLSMAYREKGVRERVRLIKTDAELKAELSQAAAELFIQATAMSQTLGDQFSAYGGDYILTALNLIQKEIRNLNENRNPLGYDERYIPLNDFADLIGLANTALAQAAATENEVRQESRDYDYIQVKVEEQKNALHSSYMRELEELTGCDDALPADEFALCVESAGGDLYDCSMDLDAEAFEACVQSKDSGAYILGAKYRQIKDSDLSLDRAQLRYENIGKQIEYQNASMNYQIEIWKDYTGQQKEALDEYEKRLTGSYLVTKTKEKVRVKDRETGKITKKKKRKTTQKVFTLRDDKLDIELDKEKDLLDATLDFQIKQAKDDTAIKNLLLEQADAMIAIDMAVHNQNMMIAAFDAAMRQKENLLALWRRNLDFIEKYWTERLPIYRILQSQAILQLTDELNEVAHYSYLATKALEYKYMQILEGVDLGALGWLNQSDLFKCQTTSDFSDYLAKLQAYDTLGCPVGEFQADLYGLSVATDVLGLTKKNLGDLDEDGYVDDTGRNVEDARYEKFQEFVNQHIDENGDLTFTFTTSVFDKVVTALAKTNLKIWRGSVPCDPSRTAKGLVAGIYFRGSTGTILPIIEIAQRGSQTFLRPTTQEIAEYYPIKALALLDQNNTDPEPYTWVRFTPLIGIDPRFTSVPIEQWTSAFANRGIAASEWRVTLFRESQGGFDQVPFGKLKDIRLFFDAIGNSY